MSMATAIIVSIAIVCVTVFITAITLKGMSMGE